MVEGNSPFYTLPSIQNSTFHLVSAVKATSTVVTGTPFGNMIGVLKPPPFDSRTPATIIRELKRHFLISISHRAETLTERGFLTTIEPARLPKPKWVSITYTKMIQIVKYNLVLLNLVTISLVAFPVTS
jgi:hypothetical protein